MANFAVFGKIVWRRGGLFVNCTATLGETFADFLLSRRAKGLVAVYDAGLKNDALLCGCK